jgi:hypothetical protein
VPATATDGVGTQFDHHKYVSYHAPRGVFLISDGSKISFAIIRHNIRTYESGGVVAVIRGRDNAQFEVEHFEAGQSAEDRHAGWRYFLEKTRLKAGTDPQEATHLRQMDLEIRESQALALPDRIPNPTRRN